MSKSRGNVQDPDELVARYGADSVRLFLMFMGPWDQGGPWSPTGIGGVHRFLNRVWTLALDPHGREPGDPESGTLPAGQTEADAARGPAAAAHKTLRDVTADYEGFRFNTMVAKLMELANTLFRYRGTAVAGAPAWDEAIRLLLLMLAPAAPHIAEELWSRRLAAAALPWSSIHTESWPEVDRDRRRRVHPRDPRPGQRQAARQGRRRGRRDDRGDRGRRPGPRTDPGDPRRPYAGPDRRGRRRQAREPRHPMTADVGRRRSRSTGISTRPRRPSPTSRGRCGGPSSTASPVRLEVFDAGDGILVIGTGRSMRDFLFAIIPHKAHVNLQLADGVDLPNRDGRIEGTGKRIRHVKVRSVEDAGAPWVRDGRRGPARHRGMLASTPAPTRATGVDVVVRDTVDLGPRDRRHGWTPAVGYVW